mgnify:CR=1 FL=1
MATHPTPGAHALGLVAPQHAHITSAGLVPLGTLGAAPAELTALQKNEAPGWQAEGDEEYIKTNKLDSANHAPLAQVTSTAGLTMTSREIAVLTGKRHDNVMADARKMLEELHGPGGLLNFQDTQLNEQNGQRYAVIRLPKRETLILVSAYSVKMRAAIIDRLDELERGNRHVLPDFNDPAAAARAWADEHEQRQRLELANRQQAAALAIAAPKAAGLDRISAASEGAVSLRVAAKLANVPEQQFIGLLIEHCWICRQRGRRGLMGKADKERAGWIEMKRVELDRLQGPPMVVARVLITQRGLAQVVELIERKAPHLRKAKTATASQQTQLLLPIVAASAQEGRAP